MSKEKLQETIASGDLKKLGEFFDENDPIDFVDENNPPVEFKVDRNVKRTFVRPGKEESQKPTR